MNIKALALTALTAATAIAAPADAYTVNKHGVGIFEPKDAPGVYGQLIKKLADKGVFVVAADTYDGYCEQAKPGFKRFGWYDSNTNLIGICSGLTGAEAQETLAHEAVHAYQDYRAGLNNSQYIEHRNVVGLFQGLSPDLKQAVLAYDVEDQRLEAEAWFFQSRPKAVLEAWTF